MAARSWALASAAGTTGPSAAASLAYVASTPQAPLGRSQSAAAQNWEGGIRVIGLVSGGALPAARRGQREQGLVTAWDWMATIVAGIAGLDPTDHAAAKAGLPPHDSVNQWPLISGANSTAPRSEFAIGDTTAVSPNADGRTLVGGVVARLNGTLYKLLVGDPGQLFAVSQDVLTGPRWPNASSHLVPLDHWRRCSRSPKHACLFDLDRDEQETTSLAEQRPDVFEQLLARVDQLQRGVYSPVRGRPDPAACKAAERRGGVWGPFA